LSLQMPPATGRIANCYLKKADLVGKVCFSGPTDRCALKKQK
jgi:hypothetical protein